MTREPEEARAPVPETLALIAAVYAALPSGADADPADRRLVEERAGADAATYGEIDPAASARLLDWLTPTATDVVVDVGSGIGRLAIQSLLTTATAQVVAIELSPFRHAVACRARDELARRQPELRRRLEDDLSLICGDFRDHFPGGATLVYAGSICFSAALMSALGRAASAAAGLRRLVTLKEFPAGMARGLSQLAVVDLDMSWTVKVRAFVYGPPRR